MGEDLSRRDLIRHSSTGIAAVGIAGLAGCTGSVPFLSDEYDSVPIGNWLVDPTLEEILDTSQYEDRVEDFEFSDGNRSEVSFESAVPEAIFDNADELDDYGPLEGGSVSRLRSRVSAPASEIDWQLTQSMTWDWEFTHTQTSFGSQSEATESQSSSISVDVIGGSFDPEEIEENLESWADDNLTDEGQYEGFDFYETFDAVYGVSGETIVQVTSDQGDIDLLETLEIVIDANVEGSYRLTDDDDANELLSQFDQGHVNSGFLLEFDDDSEETEDEQEENDWRTGLLGGTSAESIDGQTTDVSTVFLFDLERYAVADDVEEYVRRNRDITDEFATLEDYSVEEDGRTVTVTGTVQTQAYF
ncbi:hypothetical protein [Halostagnicola sp. A-GB9-2]|uniref:hypothetical protein n=1 Tax=Halostagnicola sp. A-GB9-2 TaxID=3048066 RepID=UPI0024BF58F7|nr:hypothetical protein [Halostagnicola sp. A-GB9-2]MDJ1432007.1 hypothetical protein [Halostagnicola sp. A-GB9-2]